MNGVKWKDAVIVDFDHRLDNVNDPAMTEAVNGHQMGFIFRLEQSPFYREADEHSGRTPTILYLERIGPILEVVVQAYVLCVMDVPRGSGKCVRFSGDTAVQELRRCIEDILAIRESEELAEEAVRLGHMVSSDAPLY